MKGGQNSGVTQMELEVAKNKLEETVHLVDTSMETVLHQDVDRTAQLKALIDSQAEYYEKSANLLRQLSLQVQNSITSHTPRRQKTGGPQLMNNQITSGGMPGMGADSFNSNQQFQNFNSQSQTQNQANPAQPTNNSQNAFGQTQNNQPAIAQSAFNSDPWGSSAPTTAPAAAPRTNVQNTASFDPWGSSSGTASSAVPVANATSNTQSNFYALPPATDNNDPFNLGGVGV